MRAAEAVLEGRYEVEREIDDDTLVVRDRRAPECVSTWIGKSASNTSGGPAELALTVHFAP